MFLVIFYIRTLKEDKPTIMLYSDKEYHIMLLSPQDLISYFGTEFTIYNDFYILVFRI
jgi:hypothetical protein